MLVSRRYSLRQILLFGRKYILIFLVADSIPVCLYHFLELEWISLPWQPFSLIGIAVAFYLGFKNNSSYERLWEARKIWGDIVNVSKSFTVMVRDFIQNDRSSMVLKDDGLNKIKKRLIYRHIAWLHTLTIELRKLMTWEHHEAQADDFRNMYDMKYNPKKLEKIRGYLTEKDYNYVMNKGNKASHLLSLQSKDLMEQRAKGYLDILRYLELQRQITELYKLQGKSEGMKSFPFPRQYATVNYFFVVLFVILLPFGMLDAFTDESPKWLIWLSIPFSVIGSWVFWTMEMVSDYTENPFEGLHNDVPINSIVNNIEIDIRQMLEETDLPEPMKPEGEHQILF